MSIASSTGRLRTNTPRFFSVRTRPGFLEHAEGLAQRPARDAEAGGEGHLGELFARRQLAGEDHPLELALHHARERAGLQQRDGRVGRGRDSGDGSGHGRSRPVRSPIVNNLQETVDAFVHAPPRLPGRRESAKSCHRIGIGFARAGGRCHRSFTQSIQGSSHESGFIQGAARRRAAGRFLRRARAEDHAHRLHRARDRPAQGLRGRLHQGQPEHRDQVGARLHRRHHRQAAGREGATRRPTW